MLVTPVARIWRFAAVALVAGLAGRVFRSSVRDNAWAWLAIYAGLWMFEYALYFRELAERYG
ncbi:MAG: hypothetical protein AUH85_00580 [Chloroflexi bacterium 13_1_40CM_4_68_4]|nr:MAG: hypothetical protein AUH85_00580 [Chloroflexi bacterium 13_1_40CM_4_68_4]